MIKDKRGITTLMIIAVIFIAFFAIILLIAFSYSAGLVDDTLSNLPNTIIGSSNMSLNQTFQEIVHPALSSLKTTVPQTMSMGLLLGMILIMILIGYYTKSQKKVWITLDILILIVAEILAFVIKTSFESYLNGINIFLETARDILPFPAKFILSMPILVPVFGGIVILATYMLSKERKEEEEISNEMFPTF